MDNAAYAEHAGQTIRNMYANVGKPVPGSFVITRDGEHARYRSLDKACMDIAANRRGWTMWNAQGHITDAYGLFNQSR